jgi:hypothetical protein
MEQTPQTSIEDEESYEAIERAVMETARGRWFLAEFALRNRQAETVTLLHSIGRLERVIGRNGPLDGSIEWQTKLSRLSGDIDLLLAAMMGDAGQPSEAQAKLQTTIADGQRSCIELAVIADAARDLATSTLDQKVEFGTLTELESKLSELVRLSADQMAVMRRFEALSEILHHVRTRIKEILKSPPSPLIAEPIIAAPANDHSGFTGLSEHSNTTGQSA